MRTKTLILTAALSAAGIVASMAQVFSVNVVGYINTDVPPGFSLFANQLDNGNGNRVADILAGQDIPLFSTIFKFNGETFDDTTLAPGGWTDPDMELAPGQGAFFNSAGAEPVTLTFVGEVKQGALSNPIPVGFSIRSSEVPQAGDADQLELTGALNLFDTVFQFDPAAGNFTDSTLAPGGWQPAMPQFSVGEAFFINAGAATSWDRNFTIE